MLTIQQPAYTARMAFNACISRIRNAEFKSRLEAVAQEVEDASTVFHATAIRQALHEIARESLVGGDITKEEMGTLYERQMASREAPGRYIYDEIIGSAPQGCCPLCARRAVATLDHHLPRAHYPALAVTPLNLVPSCRDCNMMKHARFPQVAEDVFLHPYYDDIDEDSWLVAGVDETEPAATHFEVRPPNTWDSTLAARVQNHFQTFRLGALYGSGAAEELSIIRHMLSNLHAAEGADAIRDYLEDYAESCSRVHRNGWRSAAYRAWADSDWFCEIGFAFEG